MIEPAAALAKSRDWDYEIISPLQLALATTSPRHRIINSGAIYCSIDGGAWGIVLMQFFEPLSTRIEDVGTAVLRLKEFCAPAELDLKYEVFIRYALDLEIDEDVENQLGRAIDEGLAHLDMAWAVLQLVNFAEKSADDAIAEVSASVFHEQEPT